MKKTLIIVFAIFMTVSILCINSSAADIELLQHEDFYWFVENDYAVIAGNIYDDKMEMSLDTGITDMVIPAEIDGYPVKIFDGNFDMWSPPNVILPEGLTTIRKNSFNDSPITHITIPSTVTTIEAGAFCFCSDLEEITVADGNLNYKSDNGILYSADMKKLLCYPGKRNVENGNIIIPQVEEVCSYAITQCFGQNCLTFQEGLQTIDCNGITENLFDTVYFPSTLKNMDDYSFSSNGCSEVYFYGDIPCFGKSVFSGTDNVTLNFTILPEKDRCFVFEDDVGETDFQEYLSNLKNSGKDNEITSVSSMGNGNTDQAAEKISEGKKATHSISLILSGGIGLLVILSVRRAVKKDN